MSYFAEISDVKILGNLPKVPDATIEAMFPDAKREVVDRIGLAKYDELYAKGAEDEDYKNVKAAECRFVLYYLVPAININSGANGISKASGVGDGRKENISEADIDRIIERHKDAAEKILKAYARAVDNDEDENPDILVTPSIKFVGL